MWRFRPQNQTFNALLFVYREVLHVQVGKIESVRATRPGPGADGADAGGGAEGDSGDERNAPIGGQTDLRRGLRLLEALRLRVQDLDFEMKQLTVRDGKGAKDRCTVLAESVLPALREHLERVKLTHEQDLASALAQVLFMRQLDPLQVLPQGGEDTLGQHRAASLAPLPSRTVSCFISKSKS